MAANKPQIVLRRQLPLSTWQMSPLSLGKQRGHSSHFVSLLSTRRTKTKTAECLTRCPAQVEASLFRDACRSERKEGKILANLSLEVFKQKISTERICTLVKDFWDNKNHKPNVPRVAFVTHLKSVLTAQQSRPRSLTENLLNVFIKHFQLGVEVGSSCLNHSRLLPEWCSETRRIQFLDLSGVSWHPSCWKDKILKRNSRKYNS